MPRDDDIEWLAVEGLPAEDVRYAPCAVPLTTAARWFADLHQGTDWRRHELKLFGKTLVAPRLSAWHGDPQCEYGYSGIRLSPQPWSPTLTEIRGWLKQATGLLFNAVLVNLYRDGRDSMGWHSDDEPELGVEPTIASLSLGAVRRFRLRRRSVPAASVGLDLASGSLLLLGGKTQRRWQHALPKTRRAVGARINLTFRTVLPPDFRRLPDG